MATDVTIREVLLPALEAAFPGSGLRVSDSTDAVAVFPAVCAEVWEVQIFDDDDEATVVIEHVTHHHSNPYDSQLTSRQRAEWVARQVVEFLLDLFDDRELFWAREQGSAGGGWTRPYDGTIPDGIPEDADLFVWSGRVERTGARAQAGNGAARRR